MRIEIDDLSRPAVHALLEEHLQNMFELSPPECVHALDDRVFPMREKLRSTHLVCPFSLVRKSLTTRSLSLKH